MALSLFSSRLSTVFALGLFAVIPAAEAQLLPDIGGRVNDVAGDIDRQIEDRVENNVEAGLDAERVLDGVGRIVGSVDVGNTLDQTIQSVGAAQGTLNGIVQLPGAVVAGRPIDLDMDDGWPVVRNEWVVLVPSERASAVEALDVDIVERTNLSATEETLFIVGLTSTAATAETIESELASLGAEPFDRNHVFSRASGPVVNDSGVSERAAPATSPPPESDGLRVGLIDTDVDENHPALKGVALYEKDFVAMGTLRPQSHGTAVASILAKQPSSETGGERELLAASAFFLGSDGTTGATSASLIQSIDWLQANGADVINVSLTGPPNRPLEAVIRSRQAAGVVFVAAVGNEGPASGPLYPAAYDGVVGVTAVDEAGAIYRWANRGAFVDVAALGVNVMVAMPGSAERRDSGTSFAAPVIAAFLGGWTGAGRLEMSAPDDLIRASVSTADPAGRNDTIGYGILVPTGSRPVN